MIELIKKFDSDGIHSVTYRDPESGITKVYTDFDKNSIDPYKHTYMVYKNHILIYAHTCYENIDYNVWQKHDENTGKLYWKHIRSSNRDEVYYYNYKDDEWYCKDLISEETRKVLYDNYTHRFYELGSVYD